MTWGPGPQPPGSVSRLLHGSPRAVAALGALAAAGLTTLGGLFLLLLTAEDFDLTFGDRVRIATSVVTTAVPLLLAAALVLRERHAGQPAAVDDAAFSLGAVVVGGGAGLLLVARLLANLFAGEDALFSGGFDGFAGRLSTFLVDLGQLGFTAALTWWALQHRKVVQQLAVQQLAVQQPGVPPPPGPPGQQWGPPPGQGPYGPG